MSMQNKGVPEQQLPGIQKPPKHVYIRRGKKQQVTDDEEINKSPSNKLDKEKGPDHESSKAKRIGTLMGVIETSEEVRACREEGENSATVAATPPINSRENKISEESSKTNRAAQFKNSTTTMIGKDRFKGIPKPPIIHVYKRRDKTQKDIEAINKSPSEC